MSKTTVDSRVVEMRFDNRDFEKNVSTTMSSLKKLEQGLDLKGASKGLENINAAAGKVDLSVIGKSVETMTTKFSAMEVMAVTALANITNSAVEAGKRMLNALTVEPVGDGFKEYEMTLNAVQTTMAGTEKTAEEVEKELKKLDEYADKTIYSTADMLNNLPKFTNAGVALEDATKAMIGISNATALAGGDANKASIAFYNLGQAIGTGYLSRMDYNSINNAGIATMEWKNQMVDAAIQAGTLTKVGDDLYQAGSKQLTLQQLFIDGLQEQWATTDVMMKVFGDYGDETTEVGKKSYSAAQDVKTFTMMMDSLKATAGTGWKDTWQHIFGGLDEAKKFWTGINNFLSGIIGGMNDWRNNLLEGALGSPFGKLVENVMSMTGVANDVTDALDNTISKIEDLDEVARRVIRGDYLNTDTGRREKLMADGYNWAVVQNRVNEMLGSSVRHDEAAAEAQLKKANAQEKANAVQQKTLEQLLKMSDAELLQNGYTKEQIESLRMLADQCEKAGISMEEFLKDPSQLSGRTLLMNSLKNIAGDLVGVFKALGDAWVEVFPPVTADQLYGFIAGLHKLSGYLQIARIEVDEAGNQIVVFGENGEKLMRTFKGVFSLLGIFTDFLGGGFKLVFKAVSTILGYFDLNVLDVTAAIGDALVKLREYLDVNKLIEKALDFIVPAVKNAGRAIEGWIESFKQIPKVQEFLEMITKAFEDVKNIDLKSVGQNIIDGLLNGLDGKVGEVVSKIIEIGTNILTSICEVLGIHSPSVEFFKIGENIIQGLINGISSALSGLWNMLKGLASEIVGFFGNIDWGALLSFGLSAGMVVGVVEIGNALTSLVAPLEGVGDILETVDDVLKSFKGIGKSFKGLLKSISFTFIADAVQTMAVGLAILVGALIALTFVDTDKLWGAMGVLLVLTVILGGLAGILVLLAKASDKLNNNPLDYAALGFVLLSLGGTMLMLAGVVKIIGNMDFWQAAQGVGGVVVLVGALVGVIAAYGKLVQGESANNVKQFGSMLLKLSVSLLLMVAVVKLISKLNPTEIHYGIGSLAVFSLFTLAISKIVGSSKGDMNAFGNLMLKMSAALLLTVAVFKMAGKLSHWDILNGVIVMGTFTGFVALLTFIANKFQKDLPKVGSTLLAISASMLILVGVMKLAGSMEVGDMVKGGAAILAFTGIMFLLIKAVDSMKAEAPKMAANLIAMSVAIGIMAGAMMMISLLSWEGIAKGVIAMGLLSAFMAGLIFVTKYAQDCKGTITALAIVIGVLTVSVVALSFVKPEKLAGAVAAMSILMVVFGVMAKMASNINSSLGTLIIMGVVIGLLAGAVYALSTLETKNVLSTAASLGVLMVALSASLVILSGIGTTIGQALLGVVALTAMAVPLLAFVGVLALMNNVQNATNNALALIALVGALTLFLIPLALVGAFIVPALLGVTALTVMAIPLLAFVGILAIMQNIENATANADLLMNLMDRLTNMLIKVSIIAPLAVVGVAAMTALTGLIVAIGVLATGIGGLMTLFPDLQDFLNTGLPILEQLAGALGRMIGAFVGGFVAGALSGLPEIGLALSMFMVGAMPFLMGIKMVDDDLLAKVGMLTASILLLTAADFISGILTFGSITNSFMGMGVALSAFAVAAMPFFAIMKNVDPESLKGVKALAEAMLVLTGANLLEQLTSWITGGSSLSKFGEELAKFGPYMQKYSDAVTGIDNEAVKASADAAKSLAEMADSIPNSGGLFGELFGENDIQVFGEQLVEFGTALVDFGTAVQGIDTESISTSVGAAQSLVDLADAIPNSGGLFGDLFGDNNIQAFGANLVEFGDSLKKYGEAVKSIDAAAITASVDATKGLADMASTLNKSGGLFSLFTGKNDLATFGKNLNKFGTYLNAYCETISTVDTALLTSTTESIGKLIDLAKKAEGTDFDALGNLGKALKKLAKSSIDEFTKKFEDSHKKAKTAVTDMVDAAADAAETKQGNFYNVGMNLVKGFANGIDQNTWRATAKAKAMAAAAAEAAKKELDEHSPSKVGYQIGDFFGMAFVNAIGDYETTAYDASESMAEHARRGLSNAISKIKNVLENDIDTQPTIRPVLDLSGVSSGVGALNGMLGMNSSVGVMSNVRAISSSMSLRQNGMNDDVIAAINNLGKALGNTTTNTYHINGVTYDDGSNISNAVQEIVRAAKVGRRI